MNGEFGVGRSPLTRALLSAVLLIGLSGAASGQSFEATPIQINAALVVPDGLMVGPTYKIDAIAVNDGYSNTYRIITSVGTLEAVGDYDLARRVQEVNALHTLDEMSRAGVFGDAMKGGVTGAVEGGKALVAAPVETTKGAVKGMGRWMGNIGRGIKSKDPYQEGGVAAAVGWAGTKRAFALELGVDPYTDWEPLQQALTSVARAAFAGGITVGVAMDAVAGDGTAGTIVTVVTLSADMNAVLQDNPPELLTELNTEKLEKIKIPKSTIKALMLNYNYTPVEKTLLVESLVRMEGAKGRELFVAQAAAAPDRIMARYMHQSAEMMANYHNDTQKVDIVDLDNVLWLRTAKGDLVGVFPIDYLAWTEDTSRAVDAAAQSKPKSREILLEGSASPTARKALTAKGWTVKDRVAMLTGDPLQDQTAAGAGMGATGAVIGIVTQ